MVAPYDPFLVRMNRDRINLEQERADKAKIIAENQARYEQEQAQIKQQRDVELTARLARGVNSALPEQKNAAYQNALRIASEQGIDLQGMPTQYTKEVDPYLNQLSNLSPDAATKTTAPSAVREFEFYKGLGSPEEQAQFMAVKRGAKTVDLGNTIGIVDPLSGQVTQQIPKELTPAQEQAGQIAYETEIGKRTGELETARPIAEEKALGSKLLERTETGEVQPIKGSKEFEERKAVEQQTRLSKQQAIDNSGTILRNATQALDLIRANPTFTTGTTAKLTDMFSESPAGEVKALLDTVSSNVALNKLIEVKQAGGTFGALQEKEFDALADSLGKLKNTSNPKVLMQNIENVIKHYTKLTEMFSKDLQKPSKYMDEEIKEESFDDIWGNL